jgi:hypothetical protein
VGCGSTGAGCGRERALRIRTTARGTIRSMTITRMTIQRMVEASGLFFMGLYVDYHAINTTLFREVYRFQLMIKYEMFPEKGAYR